jgi:hypothetical protein
LRLLFNIDLSINIYRAVPRRIVRWLRASIKSRCHKYGTPLLARVFVATLVVINRLYIAICLKRERPSSRRRSAPRSEEEEDEELSDVIGLKRRAGEVWRKEMIASSGGALAK